MPCYFCIHTQAPFAQYTPSPWYSPLDGAVNLGEVAEDKVDELLVLLLADVLDKGRSLELLAELVRGESVFGEAKVKVVENWG